MPSFNKVILMGHLTRSPELRYTSSGTPVVTIGMASNRRFKQGPDLKEEVCFVDVVAFGKVAETITQYVDKGDCVQVEGRLQQRRGETNGGEARSKHKIVADHVTFIKTKKGQQEDHGPDQQPPYE